jgi:hypothetical protein
VKEKFMGSEAAPTQTCLECFSLLTADQLAALNQVLANGIILNGYTSIDSFCEAWKRFDSDQRLAFDFEPLMAEMQDLGIDASVVNKVVPGCLMGSKG